ncbi:MAG: SpoIIE family protein phosphatase [Bryobacterales bacterium]|nr:SpoIIE family protein phosphatase [Bryobacterales bacterium]
MIDRLLRLLLWDKRLTPRWRTVAVVLLALAPLAWAGALFLQFRIAESVPFRIVTDRERALEAAHRLAERFGFDTQNWQERVKADTEMDVYRYLYRQGERGWKLLGHTGAWSTTTAKLNDADNEHGVELELAPSGEMTGYRVRPRPRPPEAVTDEEARAIALARQQEWAAARPGWEVTDPTIATDSNNNRMYQWTVRVPGLAGLDGKLTLRLRGRQIIEDRYSFELNRTGRGSPPSSGRGTIKALNGVVSSVVFVYLVVRYVRRRLQKEASRERMHLVALITGSAMLALFLLTDFISFGMGDAPVPFWAVLVFTSLGCYGFGMLAGLAYSAVESDLREPFGDQFVSLDAWLAGRFFSRNVGRSVILGVVLLGWMLLIRNSIYLAGQPLYPGLDVLEGAYDFLAARAAWVVALLGSVAGAIYIVLAAMLAPLTVVTRRFVRRRYQLPVFWALGMLAIAHLGDEPLPWYSGMASVFWQASALAVAFLLVDLLAALVVSSGFVLLVYFFSLARIAPAWGERMEPAVAAVVVMLLAAVFSVLRGRFVRADEVRPAYARDIQERLQLQSEVTAAREAQQRLLPAKAPELPGVSIVATCRSAEQVSGDFYDFFPIGKEKLGILLTDGGGNGLATALSIALTKGYLMHKAQAGQSPMKTLAGLLATLGQELHSVNSEGLCYAVLDLREGWLQFARLGETPGLLVADTSDGVEETRYGHEGSSLWEGRVRLKPDMRLVLYTNGVSRLIGEPDRQATNRWLQRKAASVFTQAPAELLEWLLNLVMRKRGGLAGRRITDDVTLMVIAVDREASFGIEERVA